MIIIPMQKFWFPVELANSTHCLFWVDICTNKQNSSTGTYSNKNICVQTACRCIYNATSSYIQVPLPSAHFWHGHPPIFYDRTMSSYVAGYIYLLRRTPVRLDMKVAKVAICFKKRPRLRIAEAKKTTCKKDLKEESCWPKRKVFGFYIYKMFELGVSLKNWLTHQYLHPNPLHPPQNCQETVGQCDACCGMARLHSWCFFCGVKFPFQVFWNHRTNTENWCQKIVLHRKFMGNSNSKPTSNALF